MVFIETNLFTEHLAQYLSDEEYTDLQGFLIEKPDAGSVIQGTRGLRKLRWPSKNKGKRGGIRIIYYRLVKEEKIYFLTLYAKNEMSDLSANEKKVLNQIVEEL
jgi:hypothetical protein